MSNPQKLNKIEQHLLFYGKDCSFSNNFRKILQEYPSLNVLFKKLAVEDLDWAKMADEMEDSNWYKQTPQRAERLIVRVDNELIKEIPA